MNRIAKLIQLSAKADQLLQFGYISAIASAAKKGFTREGGGIGRAISGAAKQGFYGAGGTKWGAAIARDAIGGAALGGGIGAVGGGISGAMSDDPDRSFLKGAASGAAKGAAIGGVGAGALAAGMPAISRGLAKTRLPSDIGQGMNEIIRQGGYRGKLGQFSSRHSALIQLSAKLDTLIQFEKKFRNITGNVRGAVHADDEGNLYAHSGDVEKGSDMLNYPNLRHGEYVRIVNKDGSVAYQSRATAKTLGTIGGAMAGGGIGAGGAALMSAARGKALMPKKALAVAGAGAAIGAGLGFRSGARKPLPQNQ